MNDRFRLDPQRHSHVHGVVVADGDVPLRQMHQHVIALPLENKHLESDTSLLSTASRIRANRITARYFSRVSRTHIISDSTATRVRVRNKQTNKQTNVTHIHGPVAAVNAHTLKASGSVTQLESQLL